jgi:hypothetical protein
MFPDGFRTGHALTGKSFKADLLYSHQVIACRLQSAFVQSWCASRLVYDPDSGLRTQDCGKPDRFGF